MDGFLKQSTAVNVIVGPFLDETDGCTAETAIEVSSATIIDIYKGITKSDITTTSAGKGVNDMAHVANGYYSMELTTGNTDTAGAFKITGKWNGALPVWHNYSILPANIYDSLIGGTDTIISRLGAGALTAGVFGVASISSGVFAASALTAGVIATAAFTSAKFATGTLSAGLFSSAALSAGTLDAGTITSAKLATAALTAGIFGMASISSGIFASAALTAGVFGLAAISSGVFDTDALTAGVIADNAITMSLGAGALSAGVFGAAAISSGVFAANALTAGIIAASALSIVTFAADTKTGNYFNAQIKGQDDIDFGATQKASITSAVPTATAIATEVAAPSAATIAAVIDVPSAATIAIAVDAPSAVTIATEVAAPSAATIAAAVDAPSAATIATAVDAPSAATIAAEVAAPSAATINAQVVDALATDTYAEPGQEAPAATNNLATKIGYIFKFLRNKIISGSAQIAVYNDAGAVIDQKSTISDDGNNFTRGKFGSGA